MYFIFIIKQVREKIMLLRGTKKYIYSTVCTGKICI